MEFIINRLLFSPLIISVCPPPASVQCYVSEVDSAPLCWAEKGRSTVGVENSRACRVSGFILHYLVCVASVELSFLLATT